MIEEKAYIIEVESPFAWVETQRKSTCSACQLNKGCGTSTLQKVLGQKRTRLKVLNPDRFSEGQQIVLGLQEQALIKGSLILYALPLVSMFIFALFGAIIFELNGLEYTEGYKIIFSLSGLITGFWIVAIYSRRLSTDKSFQAVILRKADEPVTFNS